VRALGVDVGGPKKGLDVVALDDDLGVVRSRARVAVEDLAAVIDDVEPDVIAIDSPPGPALRGTSRQAERDLARLGIVPSMDG
jgi:hypothetical protein